MLEPLQSHVLCIGWDGGHSPSAVIGQYVDGQVRIYAALNDLKIGVLEPWLIQHAPWRLRSCVQGRPSGALVKRRVRCRAISLCSRPA